MLRCRNATLRTGIQSVAGIGPGIQWTRIALQRGSGIVSHPSFARRFLSRGLEPENDGLSPEQRDEKQEKLLNTFNELLDKTHSEEYPRSAPPPKPATDRSDSPLMLLAKGHRSLERGSYSHKIPRGMVPMKVVTEELKWLQDPVALANRIARLLKGGDIVLAVEMIRTAQSRKMECLVAWNNLLEHCMNEGAPKAAFRFFNDMKKRGRKPGPRTYTLMMAGLSKAQKTRDFDPVDTALKIYKPISNPYYKEKHNIIHTNSMLTVCARHGDMDALWDVVSKMPETGDCAPDATTYTIILNAIKWAAEKDVAKMNPEDIDSIFERQTESVKEAKKIWLDVLYQWKNGKLEPDGHLVGAMGNVLMQAETDRALYDVLALYNQVFGIPILAKMPPEFKKAVKERQREDLEDVPFVDDTNRLIAVEAETPEEEEPAEEAEEETLLENIFDPVIPDSTNTGSEAFFTHLNPGNKDLMILLQTCIKMSQGLGAGKAYWEHLTQENHRYKITPDFISCHEYLRLLRLSRSSREAVELLRDQMIPAGMVRGKTFRIALTCCSRDRQNPNVLKNANELLKLMETALVIPYPRVLEDYMDLIQVLQNNPQWLVALNGLEVEKDKTLRKMGRKLQVELLIVGIDQLLPHIAKISAAMEQGKLDRSFRGRDKNESDRGGVAKETSFAAAPGLKALIRARGLIDEVLKNVLNKRIRAKFEAEARKLKKWSSEKTHQQFKHGYVFATPEQIEAFDRRQEGKDAEDEVD